MTFGMSICALMEWSLHYGEIGERNKIKSNVHTTKPKHTNTDTHTIESKSTPRHFENWLQA